jgi:hypothetical protein
LRGRTSEGLPAGGKPALSKHDKGHYHALREGQNFITAKTKAGIGLALSRKRYSSISKPTVSDKLGNYAARIRLRCKLFFGVIDDALYPHHGFAQVRVGGLKPAVLHLNP